MIKGTTVNVYVKLKDLNETYVCLYILKELNWYIRVINAINCAYGNIPFNTLEYHFINQKQGSGNETKTSLYSHTGEKLQNI